MLGRTDTQTRERMYCQTIRTVRDISRDDRARIATCSLRTPEELQENKYFITWIPHYIYPVFGLGVFSMARRHALVSLRHAAPPSAMLPLFFFFFSFLGLILL